MAHNTTNLLLRGWNLLTDTFNHTELDQNWTKIDNHDHNPLSAGGNGGVQIPTAGIVPLAINNSLIATDAVDARAIVANAVTSTELANDGVTDANRAVQTNHIRLNAVTTPKLAAFPAAQMTKVTTQAVGTSALALTFDAIAYNTDSMASLGSPTRLTVNTAGVYNFTGNFLYDFLGTAGYRKLQLRLNGGAILAESAAVSINTASIAQGMCVSYTGLFAATNFVELVVLTNNATNGTLASLAGSWQSHL